MTRRLIVRSACFALLAVVTPQVARSVTPTLVGMPGGTFPPPECSGSDSASCDDEPNFITSSFDWSGNRWIYASMQGTRILLNRKSLSTGAWSWNPSRVAIDMAGADPGSTISVGSVFRRSTPTYRNVVNGLNYNSIMYFVFQGDLSWPGNATPNEAGSVCVSFSNDGIAWTPPIWAVYQNTPWAPRGQACGTRGGGVVNAEAISGFHSTASSMHFFHLEGDLSLVQQYAQSPFTLTWYSTATVAQPDVLNRVDQITASGVSAKNTPGGFTNRFFINLDATYDPANGRVYLLRSYPAPYSPTDASIPCQQAGPTGIATFPMRAQIYDMLTNLDFSKVLIGSPSSWTLLGELGDYEGHHNYATGVCAPFVLDSCMNTHTYVGGDFDSMSVHKTPLGQLYRNASGQAHVFASLWRSPAREIGLHNLFLSELGAGGNWRDVGFYEFEWPPLSPPTPVCR